MKGFAVSVGPVQLIAIGFRQPDFHGEIIANSSGCARTTQCA
jgi:hypothetical protein